MIFDKGTLYTVWEHVLAIPLSPGFRRKFYMWVDFPEMYLQRSQRDKVDSDKHLW